ncbi:MAG: class I SAM-dependent methyltransferase [Acidimicrobiia bacterium]
MTDPQVDEREAWNRRYAEGDYTPRAHPAPFLEEWVARLPQGRALDVACGTGRNALRLAEAGLQVDAVDISEVAVGRARTEADRRGLELNWHVSNIDEFEIPPAAYQSITVIRYRNRALWPRLIDGLAPDGWVLVEHHIKSWREVSGPQNPEFRLDPQELLEEFAGLRVVYYGESIEPADDGGSHYALARMVACNGDPGF